MQSRIGAEYIMNLLKIKIIVLLERYKKVTSVANELGLKQPTVSFHMRKMEEEWGAALFEMKTGKVVFTEAGKLLHHYAVRIERLYTEAESRIAALQSNGQRRKFVIGCTEIASNMLLGQHWPAEALNVPDIQLSFLTGSDQMLRQELLDGRADLIVTGAPNRLPDCAEQTIEAGGLSLLLPIDHPIAAVKAANIAPYRLAQYPFVQLEDYMLSSALAEWEQHEGVHLSISWTADRLSYIRHAVSTGGGLSILPTRCVNAAELAPTITAKPLPGTQAACTLYGAWSNDSREPELTEKLMNMIQAQIGHTAS